MKSVINNLRVKICGMREPENIHAVASLQPDFMGFIFYEYSTRHVSDESGLSRDLVESLMGKGITPVAVCVNASFDEVLAVVRKYSFTAVQLHGTETPADCLRLMGEGLTVFKAFPVAVKDDVTLSAAYDGCCSYFLFDTKNALPGGSGSQFDWTVLQAYSGKTPFFLSGGLDLDSAAAVRAFCHPLLCGFDLNSRFEFAPGLKDASRLKAFIDQLSERDC